MFYFLQEEYDKLLNQIEETRQQHEKALKSIGESCEGGIEHVA